VKTGLILCLHMAFSLFDSMSYRYLNCMNEHIVATKDVTLISRTDNSVIAKETTRQIISETTLRVMVNGVEYVSLLCWYKLPEQLALGFLYTEGIIDSIDDIEDLTLDELSFSVDIKLRPGLELPQNVGRIITSTSAKGLTFLNTKKEEKFQVLGDSSKVSMNRIWQFADSFSKKSKIKKRVDGLHSAMFQHKDFSVFCEDVGRHNCVDKIAGILLKEDRMECVSESLMFSSGRVSTEILTKLLRLRVPIYVSLTTPTSSVVDMAKKYNVTLLGYVRDGSAVLYSGRERVRI